MYGGGTASRGALFTSMGASYSDILLYSSSLSVPLPLDKASGPRSSPQQQQQQPRRRENQPHGHTSTSQIARSSPLAPRGHHHHPSSPSPSHSQHSRSSSGGLSNSRSSHETAVLLPTSSPSNSPAAAFSPGGYDDSSPRAQVARSSSTSVSATVNSNHKRDGNDSNHSHKLSASTSQPGRAVAAKAFPRLHYRARVSSSVGSPTAARNASSQPDKDTSSKVGPLRQMSGLSNTRAESVSSTSGTTSISSRTLPSTEPSAVGDNLNLRPYVQRNGRTFLNDMSIPYPLPSDLTELHRQTLRTLLLIQVFGAPVCSPALTKKPPMRVLELGCGSGFWSMMCHQYFKSRGHGGISFTGIDIAPLAPESSPMGAADAMKPDHDMKWKFVQHDLRQIPWPLPEDEYDLIMVKDMSLATPNKQHQSQMEECIRFLRPGGTLEIWESDHLIRMLRPHVPSPTVSTEDAEEQEAATSLGAYVINANTPLSAPLNPYIVDYNQWLTRALEVRDVMAVPCTVIAPILLQETDVLSDIYTRRLAIPLSEFRWEREGVGGVITSDGKPENKGKEPPPTPRVDKKPLTAGQAALRQTALLTVVQQIQALEPILREVSGKSQDEWDVWSSKMINDLMNENGTSWGESLEVGAWSAKRRI